MKHICVILFFVVITSMLQSQNSTTIIDKLKTELLANPSPKRTASIFSDLTWYFSTISTDSALYYGEKTKHSAINLGDSVLLSQAFSDIGAVYFRKGDFENSKQNYLKSYDIRRRKNDAKGIAKINNNLANIYEKTQQYELAMKSLLASLNYFEGTSDSITISVIKGNIGLVMLKIKDYNKSKQYLSEVIEYQARKNNQAGLCVSYLNLGNVYLELKDTINALKLYQKSVKACEKSGDKKGLSSGYNNIATIKTAQRKQLEARSLFEKSNEMRTELNSDLDKSNFDFNQAIVYYNKNEFENAKPLFISSEKVFNENKNLTKLQLSYSYLIQIYSSENKLDSVAFYTEKLNEMNAALLLSSRTQETAELEVKYQSIKKEKMLLEQKEETRKQKIIAFVVSILTFFVALIAYLIYRQQKQKNRQLAKEYDLKLALAEVEKLNILHQQRSNISRDLHDNIGSQLTFIISSIDSLKYAFNLQNKPLESKLDNISTFTKLTIQELRDTIWAMNADEIRFEDLKIQLLNYIDKAKSTTLGIDFKFNVENSSNGVVFNSMQGINIYRCIQEAINNSIKYAKPSLITVKLSQNHTQTHIQVADNGKGFDLATIRKGNGLNNMHNRMNELDGHCEIESDETGTRVMITLPI